MSEEFIEVNPVAVRLMSESPGWRELENFIAANIGELLELLASSNEGDERNRGRIDAFRTILSWPAIVEEEALLREREKTESKDEDENENGRKKENVDKSDVYSGTRRILSDWLRANRR